MNDGEELLLSTLIKRCGRAIDDDINRMLKQHSIARSQYRVLYYVARYGEPAQSDLIKVMRVQPSTLTSIIDGLVRKGWLVRIKDSRDKRVNRLRFTPEGTKTFGQIPDPARKLQKLILGSLGKEEAQILATSLKKIINQLS
jgi:MarR family multiple antibiotic resistance transcriptional regulator